MAKTKKKKEVQENIIGIYNNISEYDYHYSGRYDQYLNAHSMEHLLRSAAHYKIYREGQREPKNFSIIKKQFEPLRFGSAAHKTILEKDWSTVLDRPNFTQKKEDLLRKAEWETVNKKNIAITTKEHEALLEMEKVFYKHSWVNKILSNEIEVSAFWRDNMFEGILGRARIDILNHDLKVICDYKTTEDASRQKFLKDLFNYGYDIQAAWYVKGIKILLDEEYDFAFIVQEKNPPYAINIFNVSKRIKGIPPIIENANKKINQALTTYWMSTELRTWDSYPERIIDLYLPGWAIFHPSKMN